jgi:hypothetical protein
LFFFTGFIELNHLKSPVTTDFIIVFFIVHPALAVISLRQFLWLINGKQELIMENGNLTLKKRGTFFTTDKVYSFKSIKNLRKAVDEDQLSPVEKVVFTLSIFQKIFYRQVLGEVLFDYQYDTIRVFNDLTNDEKEKLIKAILVWQEINKNQF